MLHIGDTSFTLFVLLNITCLLIKCVFVILLQQIFVGQLSNRMITDVSKRWEIDKQIMCGQFISATYFCDSGKSGKTPGPGSSIHSVHSIRKQLYPHRKIALTLLSSMLIGIITGWYWNLTYMEWNSHKYYKVTLQRHN